MIPGSGLLQLSRKFYAYTVESDSVPMVNDEVVTEETTAISEFMRQYFEDDNIDFCFVVQSVRRFYPPTDKWLGCDVYVELRCGEYRELLDKYEKAINK